MAVYNNLPAPVGENKTYIYDHGTEYYGGLVAGYQEGITPTRTKNADNYYMGGTGTNMSGCNGSSVTNQKVNLSEYTKIGAVFTQMYSNHNTTHMELLLGTNKALKPSNMTRGISRGVNSTFTLNNVRLEFDISDISGEYYVGICGTAGINATWNMTLTELYLIK